MKANRRMRRGFTLVELLVVIVIIAALAGLTAPMVIRQRKKADQTQAVSNARQIGLAMFEFETEYGSFPESSLGTIITTNTGTELSVGTVANANDAFKQLIAANIAGSEEMFFCKTAYSTVKPDNVFTTDANTLGAGDVGYGYMTKTGGAAFTAAGNSGRVLAAAPLSYNSTFEAGKFDKEMYDSKAVVLKMDNSVQSLPINKLGDAILGGANTLFATGNTTVWGSDTPAMLNPRAKGS